MVVDASPRGLANWISDRVWAHLIELAEADPSARIHQSGATRELYVGLNFRIRVKRHDIIGMISSYETATFLEFTEQPKGQLAGMELWHLTAGYEWDRDLKEIIGPVLCLRDGRDAVIWNEVLPDVVDTEAEGGESGRGEVITPPARDLPAGPAIVVPPAIRKDVEDVGGDEGS